MTCSEEQRLWTEVLILAIDDALHGPPKGNTASASYRFEIIRAREYVTIPNRDFDHVCSLAGLDPEAVRDRLLRQIAKAPTVDDILSAPRPVRRIHGRAESAGKKKRYREPKLTESMPMKAGSKATKHLHNGIAMTIPEWSRETGIKIVTIRARLRNGYTFSEAITQPVKLGRRKDARRTRAGQMPAHAPTEGAGVVSDFAPFQRTGGGRSAQETPNITFSENEAAA